MKTKNFRGFTLLLASLFGLLLVVACQASAPTDSGITIDPADQACRVAADCVLVWTECSSCECGTPVNSTFAGKYQLDYQTTCSNYRGPVCEMDCPVVELQCIAQRCTAVPVTPGP